MSDGVRPRINIAIAAGVLEKLERYAESIGSKVAIEASRLLTNSIDELEQSGLIPPPPPPQQNEEQLALLKDFLNVLLDTNGHNGFSLAEIADMLGRDNDRALVELIAKIRRNGGNKQGTQRERV